MSTSPEHAAPVPPVLISHEGIRQHCSNVIHGFFEMISKYHEVEDAVCLELLCCTSDPAFGDAALFDPDLPFWTSNIAPNFTYSGLHGDFAAYDGIDISGQFKNFESLTRDVFPEFRLEVVDLWTEMNKRGEDVRTLVNYMQVNRPVGISKPSAGEVKWRRLEPDGRLCIWEVRTMGGGAVE